MKIFYLALFLLLPSIGYSQNACPGLDSLNYGGQWYHTVQIGYQCWLKENLNVGIIKPAVKDQINNDTIEKFCYNNDPAICDVYGGLYQWLEAMRYSLKIKNRGICPVGWHVPSMPEYNTLSLSAGRDGNALKQIGQGQGTNTSGFSCLLSGDNQLTSFYDLADSANLWSSESFLAGAFAYLRGYHKTIGYDSGIYSNEDNAIFGLSVRCLQDSDGLFLQSPFGVESWLVGSTHEISWGGTLADKKIQIDYTTDNGISWINIIDSFPATDGNYNWTIPNTPSKNCKVRITDLTNPNSFSTSDNIFRISAPCPGGSTVLHGGKKYNTLMIANQCWFTENLNIGTMIPGTQTSTTNGTIEKYCYNNDTANCTKYGGLYSYSEMQEPGICPTFWHLGVLSSLAQSVLYDANALKAIGQGTGFGSGSNTSGFSVLLAGMREYDGTFKDLDSTTYFPYGSPWNPASINTYYILYNNNEIDQIDAFGIHEGGSLRCQMDDVGPLLLKSPVGGEEWKVGSTQKIIWTFSNVINIRIDYSTNNGTNWINIIASTPTSAGSYQWIIPNTPSTNCKVKISSVNNPDTNSISTNVFRIYLVESVPCPGIPTIVYGGQTYYTVAIGDQCWLKENLNIGTTINGSQNDSDNGIIEKYCYNNDSANCSTYGGLYQWNEAMQYSSTEGTKGICPTGWHIPTLSEFSFLAASVNNNGNDLKEVGQGSGLGAGTNASGFSDLLSGVRIRTGTFSGIGSTTVFWCSKISTSNMAWYLGLNGSDHSIALSYTLTNYGYNIRCINDSSLSALPVELTSFTASIINNNVKLDWNTAIEINFSSFDIEKESLNNNSWQKIASVKASGNSSSPKQYSFTDKKVNTGKYNYRLKLVDLNGSSKYSNVVNVEIVAPLKFELSNAYPNPWNPTTTIRYQVPVNIMATIKVFDVLGKEVSTLVNEVKQAGIYEVTLNGKGLASGIYYYQMKAGNFIDTKKITLLK